MAEKNITIIYNGFKIVLILIWMKLVDFSKEIKLINFILNHHHKKYQKLIKKMMILLYEQDEHILNFLLKSI